MIIISDINFFTSSLYMCETYDEAAFHWLQHCTCVTAMMRLLFIGRWLHALEHYKLDVSHCIDTFKPI